MWKEKKAMRVSSFFGKNNLTRINYKTERAASSLNAGEIT